VESAASLAARGKGGPEKIGRLGFAGGEGKAGSFAGIQRVVNYEAKVQ
jgi:hypothetical protein